MSRCAVCHDDDDGTLKACPGCRTLAHEDCAKLRCPTIGCTGRPEQSRPLTAALALAGLAAYLTQPRAPRPVPVPFGGFVGFLSFFFVILWTVNHFSHPEPPPTLASYVDVPKTLIKGPEDGVGPSSGTVVDTSLYVWNGDPQAWHAVAIVDTATGIPTRTTCQGRKALSTFSGIDSTFAAITVPDNWTVSGTVYYEVQIKDDKDINVTSGTFNFNALNKQGTVSTSAGAPQEVSSCSLGTLRTYSTTFVSGKKAMLRITPIWTCMTPTSVCLSWRIETPMPIKVEPR